MFAPVFLLAKTQPGNNPNAVEGLNNPIGANSIQEFIKAILDIVVTLGTPIVVFFIIYAGFLFVIAQGKPEKLQKAKDTLLYTVIGAAILLGAWGISQIIKNTVDQIQGTEGSAKAKVHFGDQDRFYE